VVFEELDRRRHVIFVAPRGEDELEIIIRLFEEVGAPKQRRKPAVFFPHLPHIPLPVDDGKWPGSYEKETVLIVCNSGFSGDNATGGSPACRPVLFGRWALASFAMPGKEALGDDGGHSSIKRAQCNREIASQAAAADRDTSRIDRRMPQECGQAAS
jgi:hypothetical protein